MIFGIPKADNAFPFSPEYFRDLQSADLMISAIIFLVFGIVAALIAQRRYLSNSYAVNFVFSFIMLMVFPVFILQKDLNIFLGRQLVDTEIRLMTQIQDENLRSVYEDGISHHLSVIDHTIELLGNEPGALESGGIKNRFRVTMSIRFTVDTSYQAEAITRAIEPQKITISGCETEILLLSESIHGVFRDDDRWDILEPGNEYTWMQEINFSGNERVCTLENLKTMIGKKLVLHELGYLDVLGTTRKDQKVVGVLYESLVDEVIGL